MKQAAACLVLAAIICGACLGAHSFATKYPERLPIWLAKMVLPPGQVLKSTVEPEKALAGIEQKMWKIHGDTIDRNVAPDAAALEKLSDLLATAAMFQEVIDTGTDEELKMTSVRIKFLAAQLDPKSYGTDFEAAVRRTMAEPNRCVDSTAQAELLLFFYQHRFNRPLDGKMMGDAKQFIARYPKTDWGVQLLCSMSREYHREKQTDASEKVLEWGLKHFKGHPKRSLILDYLVALGHRPAPKSTIPTNMLRILERGFSAGANGAGSCGAGSRAVG